LARLREDAAADAAATDCTISSAASFRQKKDSHNGKPTLKTNTKPRQNKWQNPQSLNLKCYVGG